MTDIGFGLIDRRTVIVVILSMILAQYFLGTSIPVDMSNAPTLFFDIVILTGYIYLARSLYRLPVALYLGVPAAARESDSFVPYSLIDTSTISIKPIQQTVDLFLNVIWFLVRILFVIILIPVITLSFERTSRWWLLVYTVNDSDLATFAPPILGVLDRIGLVVISVLATMPVIRPIYTQLGVAGLLFMLVIFVFSGAFTALIKDMLSKEEKKEAPRVESVDIKNSRENPIYVEIVNRDKFPYMKVEVLNIRDFR